MRRRLFGLLVCMLILLIPVVFGLNVFGRSMSNDEYVDAPVWSIGDSWTYDVEFDQRFDQNNRFHWFIDDMCFTVTEDTGSVYKLDFVGNITGDIEHFPFSKHLKGGTIEGYEMVEKTNLGLLEIVAHIDGVSSFHHWSSEVPVVVDVRVTFDPVFALLNFPFFVGKNWIYNSSTVTIDYTISTFGMPESMHKVIFIEAGPVSCAGKEVVSVEAGVYEAFEVDVQEGLLEIYYAPEVANVVRVSGMGPARFTSVDMELVSTTYTPLGAPGKPSQPEGPTSGSAGEVYTYCAST
ncbi:MAG TPA: hypothetical protein ENI42_01415, partial [Thermoplasmatales archaeon]|nr:hypothetical protein [Thermoplasmatales archaeon]